MSGLRIVAFQRVVAAWYCGRHLMHAPAAPSSVINSYQMKSPWWLVMIGLCYIATMGMNPPMISRLPSNGMSGDPSWKRSSAIDASFERSRTSRDG
jgi:hypothetical protein